MASTKTVRVTLNNQDRGEVVINETDFNPGLHTKVNGSENVAPPPVPPTSIPRASSEAILQAYDLPTNHDPARGKPDDLRRLEEATPGGLRPQPVPHPAVLPDPGAMKEDAVRNEGGAVSGMAPNPTETGARLAERPVSE